MSSSPFPIQPAEASRRVCVIMQPTYLPWIGYFDLIDQSDIFVFLDNVQFEKQSWQQRNRIIIGGDLHWLTVRVITSGRARQLIQDVEIVRSAQFPYKHIQSLDQHYRHAPHFAQYFPPLKAILEDSPPTLALLNQRLIGWLAETLGLKTDLRVASNLKVEGERTEKVRNICQTVGATEYLSPIGASDYLLQEHGVIEAAGIKVVFQNYQHPVYRQTGMTFHPYTSVIDLLFNEGNRSLEIIRSGRQPALDVNTVRTLANPSTTQVPL
jgi:hypothetical protein